MQITEKMTLEQLFDRVPGLKDALLEHEGEDGTSFSLEGVGKVDVYEEEDDEGARTLLTRYDTELTDARGRKLTFEYWPGEGLMLKGRTSGINWL